jgi:hypothetical protein
MGEKRKPPVAPILAMFAIVVPLLTLVAYVGGYLWLGKIIKHPPLNSEQERSVHRRFSREWQADLFWPMAILESRIRRGTVLIESDNGFWAESP